MSRLKKVYDDALRIYGENKKAIAQKEHAIHISRLFRYAVNLRQMDFLSKKCMNLFFRESLVLNGYKKSQEFMLEVKDAYAKGEIYFNEGLICFKELKEIEVLNG